ncbi:MAG: hypothetical protein LUD69_05935 [Oscillospiraceae bacterium]|nr:hypothetical protein [Oscillospiraceae bacterium]
MKHYVEYMDSVEVSPALHQRLLELTAPEPKAPWKKYGAIAAALVLAVGLGAYGLGQLNLGGVSMDGAESGIVDTMETGTFDGDLAGCDDADGDTASAETSEPAFLGGYEVTDGEYAVYYLLQVIEYGWTDYVADIGTPLSDSGLERDLTGEEIAGLLGGEDAILTHLDWDAASLSGYAAYDGDGSVYLVELSGSAADGSSFTLSLSPQALSSVTDYVYPEAVSNTVYGAEVSAVAADWEDGSTTRWVSFQTGGLYAGFAVTGTDSQSLELLTSRLVRYLCNGYAVDLESLAQ